MKEQKTLFLQKRGCDFIEDEQLKSDCGNYRLTTKSYEVKGKDNKLYFVEFGLWRNRQKRREFHKITGKPLKYAKYDIINSEGLVVRLSWKELDNKGFETCWGNVQLEKEVNDLNLSYTKADILKAINYISADEYNNIILVK